MQASKAVLTCCCLETAAQINKLLDMFENCLVTFASSFTLGRNHLVTSMVLTALDTLMRHAGFDEKNHQPVRPNLRS